MKKLPVIYFLGLFVLLSCKNGSLQRTVQKSENKAQQNKKTNSGVVYQNDSLVVQKLTNHVLVHTSFLQTNSFGRVDCNGMIVVNEGEAIVFDTPADDASSAALIRFITDSLQANIKAIVPTHFHEDCVAGMEVFHQKGIPAYASAATIAMLQNADRQFSRPFQPFRDSLLLPIGSKYVQVRYFGAGHTADNLVGYFAPDEALFGGCLVKAVGADKGNLSDADVQQWPATISRVAKSFPKIQIVVPGHGHWGGSELLNYTQTLFE